MDRPETNGKWDDLRRKARTTRRLALIAHRFKVKALGLSLKGFGLGARDRWIHSIVRRRWAGYVVSEGGGPPVVFVSLPVIAE